MAAIHSALNLNKEQQNVQSLIINVSENIECSCHARARKQQSCMTYPTFLEYHVNGTGCSEGD